MPVDPEGALQVSVVRAGVGHATLRLDGPLTADNVAELTQALERQLIAGRRFVNVDLTHATVVESGPLQSLVVIHDQFRQVRGLLVLAGVSTRLTNLLRRSRMDQILFSTTEPAA